MRKVWIEALRSIVAVSADINLDPGRLIKGVTLMKYKCMMGV